MNLKDDTPPLEKTRKKFQKTTSGRVGEE